MDKPLLSISGAIEFGSHVNLQQPVNFFDQLMCVLNGGPSNCLQPSSTSLRLAPKGDFSEDVRSMTSRGNVIGLGSSKATKNPRDAYSHMS